MNATVSDHMDELCFNGWWCDCEKEMADHLESLEHSRGIHGANI